MKSYLHRASSSSKEKPVYRMSLKEMVRRSESAHDFSLQRAVHSHTGFIIT